jgi:membrane-bound lytic murein transglycosylase B
MEYHMSRLFTVFLLVFSLAINVYAEALDKISVNQFIDHMVATHHYDADDLQLLFDQVKRSSRVLEAIDRPAEILPWYKYRSIFLKPDRIQQGLTFWDKHRETLNRAEQDYGIPPQIIVSIIGVETHYGASTGNDRVMDALSTLAFHYPKRSGFFRGELEQYLLLTREHGVDPLSLRGSYAGAMGIPQFIPSSYRRYAVDFDNDGKADIWNNPADAIGSVANYFRKHGWVKGGMVAVRAEARGERYLEVLTEDLTPHISSTELLKYGISQITKLPHDTKLKILNLQTENGSEIWLGLENFYVITRYNHSALYAMAVFQLSGEILRGYEGKIASSR